MIFKPEEYKVGVYEHIDDFRCFKPLRKVIEYQFERGKIDEVKLEQELTKLRTQVSAMFLKNGWEGDGRIDCLYLPPCFFELNGSLDTQCALCFHVKQRNNGTSFLAIPKNMTVMLTTTEPFSSSNQKPE